MRVGAPNWGHLHINGLYAHVLCIAPQPPTPILASVPRVTTSFAFTGCIFVLCLHFYAPLPLTACLPLCFCRGQAFWALFWGVTRSGWWQATHQGFLWFLFLYGNGCHRMSLYLKLLDCNCVSLDVSVVKAGGHSCQPFRGVSPAIVKEKWSCMSTLTPTPKEELAGCQSILAAVCELPFIFLPSVHFLPHSSLLNI